MMTGRSREPEASSAAYRFASPYGNRGRGRVREARDVAASVAGCSVRAAGFEAVRSRPESDGDAAGPGGARVHDRGAEATSSTQEARSPTACASGGQQHATAPPPANSRALPRAPSSRGAAPTPGWARARLRGPDLLVEQGAGKGRASSVQRARQVRARESGAARWPPRARRGRPRAPGVIRTGHDRSVVVASLAAELVSAPGVAGRPMADDRAAAGTQATSRSRRPARNPSSEPSSLAMRSR